MMSKGPHRVAVLALPAVIPLELGIAAEIFGRDPHYRLTVCAEGRSASLPGSGLTVTTPAGLEGLKRADTLIIPGYEDAHATVSTAVLDAIRAAHARGARLVSICTAAFALAAAGVLDDRPATTHWRWTAELQDRYPKIDVLPNRLFVDDGDILTSAGVTTGIDLCLHLVRRDFGSAAANTRARGLVAPPQRQGGQAQFIERLMPDPSGDQLGPLRDWMLENLALPLDGRVSDGMARRRPHRSSARDPGDDHRAGREHRPLDGTWRAGLCSSGLSPADRHLTEGVPCRLAWIVNVSDGDGDGSSLARS
jgi:transcriptional regulator GlxA family with amidase domain